MISKILLKTILGFLSLYYTYRLSEVEKKLYTGVSGPTDNTVNVLKQLEGLNIKQVKMGPDYMAFLVDDGYVCRVVFQTEKCLMKKAAPIDPPDSKKDMFCPGNFFYCES